MFNHRPALRASAALTLLACTLGGLSHAHAQTVIYQQNFESPVLACPQLDGTARTGNTKLQDDFGNAFRQLNSADVLCVTPPIPGKQNYSDPSGTAGNYTIGFYGSIDTANTEAVGMAFDPNGRPFINGSVALANVKLANYTATPTSPTIGSPVRITMAYYRLRVAAGGGEPASTDFSLASPAVLGQPAVVRGLPSSNILSPILTEQVTTTNSTGNDYALDWTTHTFSVDTSSFAAGDKLVVLFTGLDLNQYVAIDNFIVTASATAPVPLQVTKAFSSTTVQPGQSTQVSIRMQGNNVGDTLGLNLRDSLPAPLTLDSIASNTCAGTETVAANVLNLAGGTVPATGCQVVLNATWPASDICSVASVTNTIADGADFSFSSGAPTAGVDATATLACQATALQVSKSFSVSSVKPGDSAQVSITITGNGFNDASGLRLVDQLPAPLILNSIASNSCGGSAASSGNAFNLDAGVVPAAGCQVVLNTTWPAADQCSVPSVTNTIVDGSDFSFSTGTPTAGIDAIAALACNTSVTPPATPTAVPLGGLWVSLGMGLGLFGLARRYRRS